MEWVHLSRKVKDSNIYKQTSSPSYFYSPTYPPSFVFHRKINRMISITSVAAGILLASVAQGAAVVSQAAAAYQGSSLTFLYQDNLNLTDNYNHVGAILLDPMTYFKAQSACASLNEALLSKSTVMQYKTDFMEQLSYVEYAGYVASDTQAFWLNDGVVQVTQGSSSFKFPNPKQYSSSSLPVLCTQTQGTANVGNAYTAKSAVSVNAGSGNTYIGSRNLKVFTFSGIRYAQFPGRFEYSSVYGPSNTVQNATAYGSQCLQFGNGAEDCFFLNIWTPYVPSAGSKKNLRPVLFWIHGGGYVGGSGAESDGSDLAQREDVVVVGMFDLGGPVVNTC